VRPGPEIAPGASVLRITETETTTGRVLRVEGRLAGAWVDELQEACRRHRAGMLDLRGLQTVDVDGLRLLRQLALDGIALEHLSGYIAALLADPP
jgi:anti-anti-sigma regulatory factor